MNILLWDVKALCEPDESFAIQMNRSDLTLAHCNYFLFDITQPQMESGDLFIFIHICADFWESLYNFAVKNCEKLINWYWPILYI